MVAEETLDDRVEGPAPELEQVSRYHAIVTAAAPESMHRIGLVLRGHPEQRFVGLGARHGLHVDQAGRSLQLGADRAYTGPDCPPDMLDLGGIPQGDYAPVPWLVGLRGRAALVEAAGRC